MMRLCAALSILSLLVCGSLAQIRMTGLRVVGDEIRNADDVAVQFRGVNRLGTEYNCRALGEVFVTPVDQESIDVMKTWNINTVRLPLNEDCWLGMPDNPELSVNSSGAAYQDAIANYVTLLTDNNIAVILTLLWTSWNPGVVAAEGLSATPNAIRSPDFWSSVAGRFRSNSGVVFDLHSEPFPNGAIWDTDEAWNCWRNGVDCTLLNYEPTGMQSLVNAVRSSGATNLVLAGGIQHANSLARWNQYKPTDNQGNLAASVHLYDYSFCNQRGCWDQYLAPLSWTFPVVVTEIGAYECNTEFIDEVMNYADARKMHYLATSWLAGDCRYGSALLTSNDGTPSDFGVGLRSHLNNIANGQPNPHYYSYDLFKDKLNYRMSDWSTVDAQLFLNATNKVHNGTQSIMFQPTVNNYMLFQCWECIDSTVHRGVEFWINGGDLGNQQLSLHLVKIADLSTIADGLANVTDVATYNVSLMLKGKKIPKNKWIRAYVNISAFQNDEKFDGIRIEAASDQTPFYLDDIRVWDINESAAYTLSASLVIISLALAALFL